MAGTIIGTPAYMAPEQACGGSADARSDVYALGIVLYEMLSGRVPFSAEQFPQLVVQILTEAPPPLSASTLGREPIPPALTALVMRCLMKKPEERPATMTELSDALASIGRGERPIPLTVEGGRARTGRGRAALSGGLALTAAALASFLFWPRVDPPAQPGHLAQRTVAGSARRAAQCLHAAPGAAAR